MSLNWSLSGVKNWETVCQRVAKQNDPSNGVIAGEKVLRDTTRCLIWLAMTVDLGMIVAEGRDSVAEWLFRVEVLRQVGIWTATNWDADGGKPVPWYPSYAELTEHIGLSTNADRATRNQFLKKIQKHLVNVAEQNVRRIVRDAATAPTATAPTATTATA